MINTNTTMNLTSYYNTDYTLNVPWSGTYVDISACPAHHKGTLSGTMSRGGTTWSWSLSIMLGTIC